MNKSTSVYTRNRNKKSVSKRDLRTSRTPQRWQIDPESVQSANVQMWARGSMVGIIAIETAREQIKNGTAFVINDQSVGLLTNGNYDS